MSSENIENIENIDVIVTPPMFPMDPETGHSSMMEPPQKKNRALSKQRKIQHSQHDRMVCQVHSDVERKNYMRPDLHRGKKQRSRGSGVVIERNGQKFILTNHHVVANARRLCVSFPFAGARKMFRVSVVADSPVRDIALLEIFQKDMEKLAQDDLVPVRLVNSDEYPIKTDVTAVGFPLGAPEMTETPGKIATYRMMHGLDFMQITADLVSGNSGGGVFTIDPETNENVCIGLNDCVVNNNQPGSGASGSVMCFAIPSEQVLNFLHEADLKTSQETTKVIGRPFWGYTCEALTEDMVLSKGNASFGVRGCYINHVVPGSLCSRAGMQSGDQLLSVQCERLGAPIEMNDVAEMKVAWRTTPVELDHVLGRFRHGDQVHFQVARDGNLHQCSVQVDLKVDPRVVRPCYTTYDTPKSCVLAGMILSELTLNHVAMIAKYNPALMKYLTIEDQCNSPALIVTHVFEESMMAKSDQLVLSPGTLLLKVNKQDLRSIEDLKHIQKAPFYEFEFQSHFVETWSHDHLVEADVEILQNNPLGKLPIHKAASFCEGSRSDSSIDTQPTLETVQSSLENTSLNPIQTPLHSEPKGTQNENVNVNEPNEVLKDSNSNSTFVAVPEFGSPPVDMTEPASSPLQPSSKATNATPNHAERLDDFETNALRRALPPMAFSNLMEWVQS